MHFVIVSNLIRNKFIILVDETTTKTDDIKFEEEGLPIMPNIPQQDNVNADKIDDDDSLNFDIPKPTVNQEMNTDYYHDVGVLELTPVTPAEGIRFGEQVLEETPSDIGEVTLKDAQETFVRTTINDRKLGYRIWDLETETNGEGLRYPTHAY